MTINEIIETTVIRTLKKQGWTVFPESNWMSQEEAKRILLQYGVGRVEYEKAISNGTVRVKKLNYEVRNSRVNVWKPDIYKWVESLNQLN